MVGAARLLTVAALVLSAMACTARRSSQRSAPGYRALVEATDINGTRVGPTANKRATLVVFFATWCHPCRNELAMLGKLHAGHRDVRIVGVNAYEKWNKLSDEKRLRAFLRDNASWLRVVRADKNLFRAFGGVAKIPTLFVFDHTGKLVKSFRRAERPPPDRAELERTLSELGS